MQADTMTSCEADKFMMIVESKLGEMCTSDSVKFPIDDATGLFDTTAEGKTRAVHRLMRVVSSLESLKSEPFYPVRCLP